MTPSKERPRGEIPKSGIKAAVIAATIPAAIVGVALAVGPPERPKLRWEDLGVAAAMAGVTFLGLFILILFVLARMQAGVEWRKRGGRPDTFTGDGT